MACFQLKPLLDGEFDMRAGRLSHIIYLSRLNETVTPSGAVRTEWETFLTARAEVLQQTSLEFLTGYGEAEGRTIIFRIRHIDGITTADRITFENRHYDLKEIKELGRRRGLELRAVATT